MKRTENEVYLVKTSDSRGPTVYDTDDNLEYVAASTKMFLSPGARVSWIGVATISGGTPDHPRFKNGRKANVKELADFRALVTRVEALPEPSYTVISD